MAQARLSPSALTCASLHGSQFQVALCKKRVGSFSRLCTPGLFVAVAMANAAKRMPDVKKMMDKRLVCTFCLAGPFGWSSRLSTSRSERENAPPLFRSACLSTVPALSTCATGSDGLCWSLLLFSLLFFFALLFPSLEHTPWR